MNGPEFPAVLPKKTQGERNCHRRKIKNFRKKSCDNQKKTPFSLIKFGKYGAHSNIVLWDKRDEKEKTG